MFDWYLVWAISLLGVDGEIKNHGPYAHRMENHAMCINEERAKKQELNAYLVNPPDNKCSMRRVETCPFELSIFAQGELVGFTVGCEERKKKKKQKWTYLTPTYDPDNPEKPTGSGLFGGGSGGGTSKKDPESGNGGPPIKF